jgi:hypothetical protein
MRHKPLDAASRELFKSEYQKYCLWAQEKATPNQKFDVEDDDSAVAPPPNILFGSDKTQTQTEILKLYQNKIDKDLPTEQLKR